MKVIMVLFHLPLLMIPMISKHDNGGLDDVKLLSSTSRDIQWMGVESNSYWVRYSYVCLPQ